jgi:CYTH domain-containing protein
VSIPVEIERKFVIAMPDISFISSLDGYSFSDIEQTYLCSDEGVTRRVRARKYQGRTVYTETKKMRIDKMSAHEDEREISREEYEALLCEIKEGTVTIFKTRHTFDFSGKVFEIDIYPNWQRTAILEVELDSLDARVDMPKFIKVIAEVTGDKRYSNAAMSHEFPKELI